MSSVLLVHGAWQDSRTWKSVRDIWALSAPLKAIDLPSTSGHGTLSDDADHVISIAATLRPPVVLVAHSYGGAVVTQAAGSVGELAGVMYVAAFKPELGMSVTDMSKRSPHLSDLDRAIYRESDQLFLREEAINALYDDPELEVRELFAKRHPQPLATFRDPLTSDVPPDVRTHYVACANDRAVTWELQDEMAQTCSSRSQLLTSHCPHVDAAPAFVEILSDFVLGATRN